MLKKLLILALANLILVSAKDLTRQKKHVTLFNVVRFDNSNCVARSAGAGGRSGTCYLEEECRARGGVPSGTCAAGFGICCLFALSATGTSSQNCTYLRNTDFPTATTTEGDTVFTIRKCADDICRLRLDFLTFELDGPTNTAEADCDDSLTVTETGGANALVPVICGENSGEHIYVDFPADASSVDLTFALAAGGTSRSFEVKATQYHCNDPNLPPPGCLQWYTGGSGRIQSFNFDADGSHLNDQLYTICVRQEKDMCCVEYSVCPEPTNAFSLLGSGGAVAAGIASLDANCEGDYIAIPGATDKCTCDTSTPYTSRFCGDRLNTVEGQTENVAICDCQAPFDILVQTNGANDDAVASQSRGFCLDYRQKPC